MRRQRPPDRSRVPGHGDQVFEAAHAPMFLFVAPADTGKVDVVELTTGVRFATFDVPDVRYLGNYFRQ